MKLNLLLQALACVAITTSSYGQGNLSPSSIPDPKNGPTAPLTGAGLPQATMKTLHQIEPRVDVLTLATEDNAQYVIKRPGSYYLSGNIVSDKDIAILILASSVSLDLNGFGIKHAEGAGAKGINVAPAQSKVTIRNGSVTGFLNGIDAYDLAGPIKGCLLSDLIVTGSTHYGILAGDSSVVQNCVSNNNGGGIFAGNGSVLKCCIACENTAYVGTAAGIFVRGGSVVSQCVARNNRATGIKIGPGSSLLESTAQGNTGTYGIHAEDHCTIKDCTASDNVGEGEFSRGISAGSGSTIIGCTARNNDSTHADTSGANGVGIFAFTRCTVKDCTTEGNHGDGIRAGSNCHIANNTCIDNGRAGVRVTGDNNRVDGNHCTEGYYGIRYQGESNLIVRNSAYGNHAPALESGNYSGDNSDNAVGPLITMNDINDLGADDRPWGNFTRVPKIGLSPRN